MPMPEYLRSRLIRLWSRAVAPFRPSTLTTVIVLAIIAVAGTYYQFNPPPALKDLPVGAFADQMRIKAAPLRPTTDPAAVAAYDHLLAGLNALFDADRRGTDVRPALSLVAARATHFARLRAIEGAESLAHAARERARTAGLSPGDGAAPNTRGSIPPK